MSPSDQSPFADDTDALALLCEVWGFLKYHHPDATRGRVHWDEELVRILPEVRAAADLAAGRAVITRWVEERSLPDDVPARSEARGEVHLAAPDAWRRDRERLGGALVARLEAIHARRGSDGPQAWIGAVPGVGNPDLCAEPGYPALPDLCTAHRLLALFRVWNIGRYWFPYRDLVEADPPSPPRGHDDPAWRQVLSKHLPAFLTARGATAYQRALIALFTEFRDGHAGLARAPDANLPPFPGRSFVPAPIRCVEDRFVVGLGADEGPLQPGDVVVSVDGQPTEALIDRILPYCSGSNEAAVAKMVAFHLLRGPEGAVRVGIARGDERLTFEVERTAGGRVDPSHVRPGPALQQIGEVAYLKLPTLVQGDIPGVLEAAAASRGLVIDLRAYPAFVVFDLGEHLVGEPTPFATFAAMDLGSPGTFRWGPPVVLAPRSPHYDGPVAILVDAYTQSRAEYTAMAFRCRPRAAVIGSRTAGADGNVSDIRLPGGLEGRVTGIGTFYPDRTPAQRVGVAVDIEARPTIAGLRGQAGRGARGGAPVDPRGGGGRGRCRRRRTALMWLVGVAHGRYTRAHSIRVRSVPGGSGGGPCFGVGPRLEGQRPALL